MKKRVVKALQRGSGTSRAQRPAPCDDNLLASLFQRYNRALKLFIRNTIKSDQAVEEIAQETYLRMLERATPEQLAHPRAYLFRTARNLAIDHLRRGALNVVDHRVEVDEETLEAPGANPLETLSCEQLQARLNEALGQLPLATRQVYYYRRHQNWSMAVISEQMGISERMVYKHMEAALKHLAQQFGLVREAGE